ncbi:MAG: chromate resistance protein ChrB domain-containing protein [Myxococcota bacterium]
MEPGQSPGAEPRWLLLIHQTPPKPDYLRVKIGRRLQRIGAVAIKSTVYVLPRTEGSLEDFQWLVKEITSIGGDATLCEARLIDGMADAQVEALFRAARDADYAGVTEEARRLMATNADERTGLEGALARLRKRMNDIAAIDFFSAPQRAVALAELAALEKLVHPVRAPGETVARDEYRGRTWVTRTGIYVDRIASAWLIRRFIDPDARFKFVSAKTHVHTPGELRFDMSEGEFTHEGDMCSFEVLMHRLGLEEPGLVPIAQIIHDLDINDGKFGRDEAPGVAAMINGLALRHRTDEERLSAGTELFENLLAMFKKRSP